MPDTPPAAPPDTPPALDPPVRLADLDLPEFGEPTVAPAIPADTYRRRAAAALARARGRGLDALVVYGDREHAANVAYLSGYDPRFEETLLVLREGAPPALLVGNEGWGYAALAAPDAERVLFQTFSLPGQPRGQSDPLPDILRARGLGPGARVGVVGWKVWGPGDGLGEDALDVPSFLADAIRALVGPEGRAVNATAILMDAADGLRAVNDADQLAVFEHAATYTSQGLRNVIFGLRPGMRETDAARLMGMNGLPQNAHPMLTAGPRAAFGLPSPGARPIERGDPLTMGYGVWGALNARAGFVAEGPGDLPEGARGYLERLVAPYFSAVVAWYEALGLEVEGGALFDAVHRRIGAPFFGVSLNPGHQIHLDEWMNSPIFEGSRIPLASGMALQADVIPATGSPLFTTNVEDGVALADEALRAEIAERFPEAWGRIEARRRFMTETLGIHLKPEVLPFSNIPAYLPPFLLAPRRAMVVARPG